MSRDTGDRSARFGVVVSGDPARLEALGALIGETGLRVLAHDTAESALKDIAGPTADDAHPAAEAPALIVTDPGLPGIDGWRFCRLLRSPEFAALNRVPVLVVSNAPAGHELRHIAADLQAEIFPFSPGDDGAGFLGKIRAILRGESTRHGPRILFVRSGDQDAGAIGAAFCAANYRVDAVGTAAEAIAAFRGHAYDLAVLDDSLTGGSVESLLEEFKAERPDCVSIVLSAAPELQRTLDLLNLGAAVCLRKPCEPGQLLRHCAAMLRERDLVRAQELLEVRTRELRLSQERHERFVRTFTDYVYTVRIESGAVVSTRHGPGCLAVTGYSEQEFDRKPYLWLDMVMPEDRDRVVVHAGQAAAGEDPAPIEHRIVRKDGRMRWVRNTPVSHRDEHGTLTGYDSLIQDITERMQVQEEKHKSENRFRLMLETIPAAVFLIDKNHKNIDYISQYFTRLFGYDREDITTLAQWFELAYPDVSYRKGMIEETMLHFNRSVVDKSYFTNMYSHVTCKDGSKKTILWQGSLFGDQWLGCGFDLSRIEEAEKAIKDSETRLRQVIDLVPHFIFAKDVDGRFIFANEAVAEAYGTTTGDLTGKSDHDFNPNMEEVNHFIADDRKVIESGTGLFAIEEVITDSRGEIRHLVTSKIPFTTSGTEKSAVLGVSVDITERKRMEEALTASEERLDLAMEVKNEGIWDWNLVTNDTVFDDRYYTMAGYAPAEFPQTFSAWAERVHPDDIPNADASLRAYISGRSDSFDVEFRFKHKNGSWMWIQGRGKIVARDGNGTPLRLIGTHTDITERKQAEESLRSSQEHLQSIFSIAPTGIGVIRDRVLMEINKRIGEMTGYSAEELVGKDARILYPTLEEYEYVGEKLYGQIREKGSGTVETRWRRKDDAVLDILLASTQLDASDMSRGLTFTALDITERKQAEERQHREDMRRQREVEVVTRVAGSDYVAEGSVQELAIALTAVAARTIDVERVGVWLFDEDETRLINVDNYMSSTGEHLSGAVLLEHEFRHEFEALKSSSFIDAHDALTDPRTAGYVESYLKPNRITSMLDAVIRTKGRNLGVLCFEHVDRPHRWQDDEIAFACRLADQIALAISHRERRQAEEALRESEEKLSALFASMSEMVVLHEVVFGDDGEPVNYRITDCNKAYTDITGIPREASAGRLATEVYGVESPPYLREFCQVGVTGEAYHFETRYAPMDKHFLVSVVSPGKNKFATITTDITDRKRAEEERERLQSQLSQAQKMESVGRLAGGVAHDFNNMLGVILGHTELVLDRMDPSEQAHADLLEIRKAAERSADLTRQLLAFARKQTVTHEVLDLNETVAKMLKMLRRLIGEDIELVWLPGDHPGPVKMDPSQIDQILANLCINARDAIGDSGKITIETGAATFDEHSRILLPGCAPGEYAMLAVSDDGRGMDQETKAHLFEPFYTTKEIGQGTGLGLSTVYGVVQQNDGLIDVRSEPGRGTTFKIFFPRHTAKALSPKKAAAVKKTLARGHETILLVEDEPAILNLTKTMLERFGYRVLPAGTPGAAINLARQHDGSIHLLMTDVVMPEMNGRDLAQSLMPLCPGIKRLFMSGYTADVIAHHGVLDEGVHFIQKPFTMQDLASKVKEALESW